MKLKRISAVGVAFLAALTILIPGPAALAAGDPLASMSIIGSDGETYLDEDDYDGDETEYEIDLDEEVTYLRLYLEYDGDDYDAEVEYDGDGSVSEKTSYWRINIDDIDDTGDIIVTLYDEDDDEVAEYVIEVNGGGSGSGTDALTGLYLNSGDTYSDDSDDEISLHPGFDEDILDYAVLLPYDGGLDGAYLNLRIYVEDEDVELTVADRTVGGAAASDDYDGYYLYDDDEDSYYYDYSFAVPDQGDYDTVEFTLDDTDYSLSAYFADEDADDEAVLDDLAVRTKKSSSATYDLELDPQFDEDEDEYDLAVDMDTYDTLYLCAEADSDMVILVEDQLADGYWSFDPADYDEIIVTVYAEDLDEYTEYTINLVEGGSYLSSLYLYTGGYGSVSLSPAFSASQYNYSAQVSASDSTLYFSAGSASTVKIAQNGGSYQTYSSYSSFSLNEGLNVFDVQVGSAAHYYINVYRQAAGNVISASSQTISVNSGTSRQIAAYNINGNNFVKLRDIAYLLNGTTKQFAVGYNASSRMITMTGGSAYTSVGGEMNLPGSYASAAVTTQSVYLNGAKVTPTAYNIDGNNYFLLRDLASLFDFGVSFSGSTVYINTASGYSYSS